MENCEGDKRIISAAVMLLLESVLEIIQNDPHQWSTRPCSSCRTISNIVGKPFGCIRYAEMKARIGNKK